MEKSLYLSDENRNNDVLLGLLFNHFGGFRPSIFYEIGDWQGLLGFVSIVPEWKADLFFKIWDERAWGPTISREIVETVQKTFKELNLQRLSLHTPDEYMTKFAKKHGFKEEGKLIKDFRWDGQYYDTVCLAMN
jgi:RimJ/RimL family protein N-acetyltransferase